MLLESDLLTLAQMTWEGFLEGSFFSASTAKLAVTEDIAGCFFLPFAF